MNYDNWRWVTTERIQEKNPSIEELKKLICQIEDGVHIEMTPLKWHRFISTAEQAVESEEIEPYEVDPLLSPEKGTYIIFN